MGFDYTEFEAYKRNFSKFNASFGLWLYNFLLDQGLKFIRKVKRNTPVDTGDLRNHWNIEGITREGDVLKCWFVNSMYYATFVEYGHAKPYKAGALPGSSDWVEGYFMMTVSLEQIEREMPQQFDAQFEQFLRGKGLM